MGVSGLTGPTPPVHPARQERTVPGLAAGAAKSIAITPRAAEAATVILDPGLQQRLDRMRPEVMAAHEGWMEEQRAYMGKLGAIVRETFGIPEDAGFMVGGAAHGVMDALAAKHGLVKPAMPAIVRDAGWDDPAEQSAKEAQSDTGVFAILHTAVKSQDYGKSLTIAFDRNADIPAEAMRVADLKKDSGALVGRVLDGALGGSVRTDLRSNSGVFAVTDGAPADRARVAATIRSVGMDDVATGAAAGMLATMMRLLKDG